MFPGDMTASCAEPVAVVWSDPLTWIGVAARCAFVLLLAVNAAVGDPAMAIEPPDTRTLTDLLPLWLSVTAIDVVPNPAGLTLKETGPGPLPDAGVTVATEGLALTAPRRPV
jgi:hypothetical protein